MAQDETTKNPGALPESRSEIALPLAAKGEAGV